MDISGIYSSNAIGSFFLNTDEESNKRVTAKPQQRQSGDTVTISMEAMRLAQQARGESEGQQLGDADEKNKELTPAEQFSEYMSNARSKAQSSGSTEEQLEKLQEKLEKLQSQLMSLTSGDSAADSAKAGEIGNVRAQINAVMAQISELKTQTSEESGQEG